MKQPSTIQKQAGALIYLIEELSDARMRCDQLKKYIQEAIGLIEKSKHKDHFFEVAGHLMQGIPQTLFKLDKALGATALAATKMDYDELSNNLKPEKVTELEKALEDSRIHYVQRRSGDTMNSNDVSSALRQIAKEAHTTGRFPVRIASDLIAQLEGNAPLMPIAYLPNTVPTAVLAAMADAIDAGTMNSCAKIAKHLEHVVLSTAGGQEMVGLLQNASSREDVMDGFKKENPALTDEQLEEIGDQWEKNKDNLKKLAADNEEKLSRYEEGVPADPTENMTQEDAEQWKAMTEEHKDEFKSA